MPPLETTPPGDNRLPKIPLEVTPPDHRVLVLGSGIWAGVSFQIIQCPVDRLGLG